MSSRVYVLLQKIDEHLDEVREHYEADLASKELSGELVYAVRQVIQDCQSALDWTATAVRKKYYPTKKWRPYFPLAIAARDFPELMDKQIKGLRAAQPKIAAAFERHQPYREGREQLGLLHKLARVEKHEDFAPQVRNQERWVESSGPNGSIKMLAGPDSSSGSGVFIAPGAEVNWNGRRLDPTTLQPIDGGPKPYDETIYVDWRFVDPDVAVLPTLEALGQQVEGAVKDVRQAADL
jgi:hypothetical protein